MVTRRCNISHVTKKKANIVDLVCLEKGADRLGMQFDRAATLFKNYAGRMSKCEGKLSVRGNKDAYEMGIQKNKEGSYDLLYDSYGGAQGLMAVIGKGASNLLNEYGAALFTKHMERQGMRTTRQTKADGSFVMVAN